MADDGKVFWWIADVSTCHPEHSMVWLHNTNFVYSKSNSSTSVRYLSHPCFPDCVLLSFLDITLLHRIQRPTGKKTQSTMTMEKPVSLLGEIPFLIFVAFPFQMTEIAPKVGLALGSCCFFSAGISSFRLGSMIIFHIKSSSQMSNSRQGVD